MFATHYHELTELAATQDGLENWSVSAREHEGDIVFFHKLQRGAASRSYGVACAKLAGLPELVLSRARTLLAELEGGMLPGGKPQPVRAKKKPQLGLFDRAEPEGAAASIPSPIVEALKNVDVDRLTPLEALQLVAQLKKSL